MDELDGIKAGYHEEVLEGEDEVSCQTWRDRFGPNVIGMGQCTGKDRICRSKSARFLRKDSWES